MLWARMLAYITGTVDQELLLRNEYLAAENRIPRAQFKGRLLLSDAEKATLAEIAQRLGRKALKELAVVAKPDTLLAWYRKLIANKFDGSRFRHRVGRPRIDEEAERNRHDGRCVHLGSDRSACTPKERIIRRESNITLFNAERALTRGSGHRLDRAT